MRQVRAPCKGEDECSFSRSTAEPSLAMFAVDKGEDGRGGAFSMDGGTTPVGWDNVDYEHSGAIALALVLRN